MKIAVFENEYESVKGAFIASNFIDFNNRLTIINYVSSQSAKIHELKSFDVVFIDIDLSSKSAMDGFSLIEHLLNIDANIRKKIVILTGNNKIQESLFQKNLNIDKIIIKPTNYEEITNAINACA